MGTETRQVANSNAPFSGPYLAKVISHMDPTYMGIIEVQLLRISGNKDSREGQIIPAKYLSPFYGVTNIDYVSSDPNDYNNTQKAYGMWMVPPDAGTTVMVLFVEGEIKEAYWIGCVQDDKMMNFSVPGYAATKYVLDETKVSDKERVPVGEYNRIIQTDVREATKYLKPAHPLEKVFNDQGLLKDDTRGITTSSARRELPSMVFGISTPGPVDKRGGAKKGKTGKHERKVDGAYVSRLGGSSFVMDDGDDKFLRKEKPSDGPPDYASVEKGEDGIKTIPHNELIRLRTRTGHQILMHNSEDLIYIGNARGTAWIELTGDGKIDIFSEDSVSIRTKADFNFYADRDFNFECGRNFNIKVAKEMQIETGEDYNVIVGRDGKLTLGRHCDTNAGGHIWETSAGTNQTKAGGNIIETAPKIHMNGPQAATAPTAKRLTTHSVAQVPKQDGDNSPIVTILRRLPSHEPWPHHENLDPLKYKPTKTDRDSEGRNLGQTGTMAPPASYWKKYSTATDTFEKLGDPTAEATREDQFQG